MKSLRVPWNSSGNAKMTKYPLYAAPPRVSSSCLRLLIPHQPATATLRHPPRIQLPGHATVIETPLQNAYPHVLAYKKNPKNSACFHVSIYACASLAACPALPYRLGRRLGLMYSPILCLKLACFLNVRACWARMLRLSRAKFGPGTGPGTPV